MPANSTGQEPKQHKQLLNWFKTYLLHVCMQSSTFIFSNLRNRILTLLSGYFLLHCLVPLTSLQWTHFIIVTANCKLLIVHPNLEHALTCSHLTLFMKKNKTRLWLYFLNPCCPKFTVIFSLQWIIVIFGCEVACRVNSSNIVRSDLQEECIIITTGRYNTTFKSHYIIVI